MLRAALIGCGRIGSLMADDPLMAGDADLVHCRPRAVRGAWPRHARGGTAAQGGRGSVRVDIGGTTPRRRSKVPVAR